METNDIKNIWKTGIEANIKSYSNSDLNEMIVKSVRKAMKPIQLGGIFQLVIIAVMAYLVYVLIFRDNVFELKLLNFTEFLFILICYILWKRSDYKMNKCDMPVKEWLEYRINELKKIVYTRTKYNIAVTCFAFLLGFSCYVAEQIIIKAPFNLLLSGSIFVGLIIYFVVVTRSLTKKYKKTLSELETLYKQIEDLNE